MKMARAFTQREASLLTTVIPDNESDGDRLRWFDTDVGVRAAFGATRTAFPTHVRGDSREAFAVLSEPALKQCRNPDGAYYHQHGPKFARHYVKMVHNAIEYHGIAGSSWRGYRLLHDGPYANWI